MSKDLSVVGRALASSARSMMLMALMDGSSRPASELAAAARISPSTASEHLATLTDAGLTLASASGRRRLYRLADPSIAAALEQLGQLCPPAPVVSYRQSRQARELARARLCYDHLAGRLGVALMDSMTAMGWLRDADAITLTDLGRQRLAVIGVPVETPVTSRPLCRACPDWTERRPHLAGRLGAALARHALTAGWVKRAGSGRGLTVTPAGRDAFGEHWMVEP